MLAEGAIPQRYVQVDILRGVAALAVTYFHLSGSSGLTDAAIKNSGSLGWLGVEIFFAISGFVIPYSLRRGGYRASDLLFYFGRRLVRLDPPYIASILLGIAVGVVGIGATYQWPTPSQLFMHLGYLTVFTDQWLNPVYWTLAVEVQYYIFVGLAFPLLTHPKNWVAIGVLVGLSGFAALIPSTGFLPHWAGLFAMGVIVFRRMSHLMGPLTFSLAIAGFAVEVGLVVGWLEALAGLATCLFISTVRIRTEHRWLAPFVLLGAISYSLYLVHWDIGRTVVSITRKLPFVGSFEPLRLCIGLLASLLAAFLFYRVVEKPSIVLSKWISYPRADSHSA